MPQSIDFGAIFTQLKNDILGLAKTTLKKYTDEALSDGKKLLEDMKNDLERWTHNLVDGNLTKKEFEYLVNTDRDSIKMAALEHAGLAAIRVDQFKNSVLNLIVDTVFHMIPV
jgi:hypothetical protein